MSAIGEIIISEQTVVSPSATVLEAVEAMCKDHRGAVAVVEAGQLKGLFSERDLMLRVVMKQLDPATLKVTDVWTTQLITATPETLEGFALRTMVEKNIRHLPIVDAHGGYVNMLSLRKLLQHRVEELSAELDSLQRFISADALGG